MRNAHLDRNLARHLATYGSDLSRWPDGAAEAKKALLAQPDFRRAWELERAFDAELATQREALDAEIFRSGAVARVKREALQRRPANFLAGIPWRRVAAGVLFAGMLGGALDLMMPEPAADPLELAIVDPLDFDGAGLR